MTASVVNNLIDWVILICIAALLALALVSFFFQPAYEKGVWYVMGAIGALLSAAAGAKFGLTVPKADSPTDAPKG